MVGASTVPTHISIIVYDDDMVRCGEVALYQSLAYIQNWYLPDTWELRINRYLPNATTLTPTGYIGIIPHDLTPGTLPLVGKIEKFAPVMDRDGKSTEMWAFSGRNAFGGKLKKRIAINRFKDSTDSGFDKLDHTTYETAARHLITENIISAKGPDGAADTDRNIAGIALEVGDLLQGDVATAAVTTAFKYVGAAYTDITELVNDVAANDIVLPPAAAINDAIYIGDATKFHRLAINLGTPGVYTATVVWEYWNGSIWTAIPGLTDGTGGFKNAAGLYDVYWTAPADWATVAVNGTTQYWIRARCSAFTSLTTAPLGTQIWCGLKLQTRGEPLLTLLETWSKASGLHFALDWTGSGNNFTFATTAGTDRTGAGSAAPVTLSVDYRNILALSYAYSRMDSANVLYAGGSGDGDSRLLAEIYDAVTRPSGEDRDEAFLDLADCTTEAVLAAKGAEQLETYLPVQSLTFEYDPTSTIFVLNQDFFCGDFVIVDWPGIAEMTDRITAVKYSWDRSAGYNVKITVGTEKPDMTSIVKKIQNSTSAIRRK